MKDSDEFQQGYRNLAKNWAIVFLCYILLLLWLEPLIDKILALSPPDLEMSAIAAFNEKKAHLTTVVFGVARSLPIILFLWLAYQIVISSRLPPKGLKIPFTVRVIKGDQAKIIGIAMIVMSLLLLFREVHLIVNA